MPLPPVIEIVPPEKPVRATITVPGSKSITNRALILAALAEGETILQGALWSEDTQVMVDCLRELGFMVNISPEPAEICNRTITVYGRNGLVPPGGTEARPLDLFVGNAGTTTRFLAALACLGQGAYRLHGTKRMHERPQAPLFQALRELGYRVATPNERLPAVILGSGPRPGSCAVSIQESSQFASGLLLCARHGQWQVQVTGENADESAYIAMTAKLIDAFPKQGGRFQVEPDASSGSYFLGAELLLPVEEQGGGPDPAATRASMARLSRVSVVNWPRSGWQIDEKFPLALHFGLDVDVMSELERKARSGEPLSHDDLSTLERKIHQMKIISRRQDLGDSIMTAIVLAPFAPRPVQFTDLGRLRLQECERVLALHTELTRCGANIVEKDDTLTVFPSKLHGAEIESYDDHRMAMCFAILGLKIPGIKIKNPSCVKKTFPNFFQKLAGGPPRGLGATILDARSGRNLMASELFAE